MHFSMEEYSLTEMNLVVNDPYEKSVQRSFILNGKETRGFNKQNVRELKSYPTNENFPS